jgi:hypothetical protein
MALGYDDTPFLPGGHWRVHDGARPQPPVVTPGCKGSAPSDAIALFDGTSLAGWVKKSDDTPAGWKVEDGYMEVVPGTGDIKSKVAFGSCQLHVEFACPEVVKGESQGRGNSGVFLMGLYEIQVLDNYDNPTYPDGTVGGIYGQYPPLANSLRQPGEWNKYDIVWEAPIFVKGKAVVPAYLTVFLNGIVLHNRKALLGTTNHRVLTDYVEHAEALPLSLQDHGDLVRFRNIWYRELKGYDE